MDIKEKVKQTLSMEDKPKGSDDPMEGFMPDLPPEDSKHPSSEEYMKKLSTPSADEMRDSSFKTETPEWCITDAEAQMKTTIVLKDQDGMEFTPIVMEIHCTHTDMNGNECEMTMQASPMDMFDDIIQKAAAERINNMGAACRK